MLGKIFYNIIIFGTIISICIFPLLAFLHKNKYKYNFKGVYKIFIFILIILILPIKIIDFSHIKDIIIQEAEKIIENDMNTAKIPEIRLENEKTIIEVDDEINIKNNAIFNISQVVPYIWISVASLMLIYNLFSYFIFIINQKKHYISASNDEANEILNQLCNEMKIKNVSCKISDNEITPMTVGLFSKKIILSKEILKEKEYEFILKHELFHIKNKDIEYKFLLLILNCIYWFNPIIYMFINQVEEILELNCDENVLKGEEHSERVKYAEILLNQIERTRNKKYKFSMNFANRRKNIMNRFSNIVDETKKKSIVNLATMSGILIIIAVLIIAIIPNINFATQDDEILNKSYNQEEGQIEEEENNDIETTDKTEKFINPLKDKYTLTSRFGQRIHNFHKGIDLATASGSDIVATKSGEVIFSSYEGAYGNLVIIQHTDSVKTYYAQCSKLNVNVGDKVNQGDVIANVGSTGNSTGPHLHFEIRINDECVNPQDYIEF